MRSREACAAIAREHEIAQSLQCDLASPVPRAKIFRFPFYPNQMRIGAIPSRQRGVSRSSRTLGAGCDGRERRAKTNGADADGEVVWSRRPDAGVKFVRRYPHGDGGNKAGHRGEHEGNRKTIVQGMPG